MRRLEADGSVVVALSAAVASKAEERQLMAAALALHEARLAWARVVLVEDGSLPPDVKDELVVAHRGLSRLLQRQNGTPG
ncbi:MAG TPA: hypothetical protein VNU26_02630 [Mycobacteriales bacterium]|nr:hypothetical protein [Mycobacteriales bacterium]